MMCAKGALPRVYYHFSKFFRNKQPRSNPMSEAPILLTDEEMQSFIREGRLELVSRRADAGDQSGCRRYRRAGTTHRGPENLGSMTSNVRRPATGTCF